MTEQELHRSQISYPPVDQGRGHGKEMMMALVERFRAEHLLGDQRDACPFDERQELFVLRYDGFRPGGQADQVRCCSRLRFRDDAGFAYFPGQRGGAVIADLVPRQKLTLEEGWGTRNHAIGLHKLMFTSMDSR